MLPVLMSDHHLDKGVSFLFGRFTISLLAMSIFKLNSTHSAVEHHHLIRCSAGSDWTTCPSLFLLRGREAVTNHQNIFQLLLPAYYKPYTNTKHTIHSIFSFFCTTNGQSPQYHMKKHPHVGLGTGATALKWRIYANTFLPPAEPCCLFWLLSPVSQVCEFSALWQRSSRLLSLIIRYHPKFCLSCPLFCPCKTEIKAQVWLRMENFHLWRSNPQTSLINQTGFSTA